jgi:hypothetical protein
MEPTGILRTERTIALALAAKADLELAARSLGEIQRSLTLWADELSTDPENLHQSAVGTQAEAIRAAMSALTIRAASNRLEVLAQLAKDAAVTS